MKKLTKFAAILAAGIGFVGCATQTTNNFEPFQASDLNSLVSSGELEQKVDNLLVIVDASSSMNESFTGTGLSGGTDVNKLAAEKEILNRLNKTIPNIKLESGIAQIAP